MGAKILRGLVAAAMMLGAGSAGAADKYAIEEHKLTPADSYSPPAELTSGDLSYNTSEDAEQKFIDAHAQEAQGWTDPNLGQELFPRVSAGTLLSATHDRVTGGNGFAERVDVDLYWLQVRVPALQAINSNLSKGQAVNLDLLLPFKAANEMRLGLLAGTDVGMSGGGFYGQRFQGMLGFNAKVIDVQARGGFGLESTSNALNGTPEAASTAPAGGNTSSTAKQAEVLYGAVVGAQWADWGRLALEANGAHLIDRRAELLTLSPGIRLSAGSRSAAELGLAALMDFTRTSENGMEMRGIGGLASLRYNFL